MRWAHRLFLDLWINTCYIDYVACWVGSLWNLESQEEVNAKYQSWLCTYPDFEACPHPHSPSKKSGREWLYWFSGDLETKQDMGSKGPIWSDRGAFILIQPTDMAFGPRGVCRTLQEGWKEFGSYQELLWDRWRPSGKLKGTFEPFYCRCFPL